MIGQGAVGWKKRKGRMNERLNVGIGLDDKLGNVKGDPSTRLGRRVEGYEAFVW